MLKGKTRASAVRTKWRKQLSKEIPGESLKDKVKHVLQIQPGARENDLACLMYYLLTWENFHPRWNQEDCDRWVAISLSNLGIKIVQIKQNILDEWNAEIKKNPIHLPNPKYFDWKK